MPIGIFKIHKINEGFMMLYASIAMGGWPEIVNLS